MNIVRIESDEEILSTREVTLQLRPHIRSDDYLPTVRRMMESDGYRLAAASDGESAGYRLMSELNRRASVPGTLVCSRAMPRIHSPSLQQGESDRSPIG